QVDTDGRSGRALLRAPPGTPELREPLPVESALDGEGPRDARVRTGVHDVRDPQHCRIPSRNDRAGQVVPRRRRRSWARAGTRPPALPTRSALLPAGTYRCSRSAAIRAAAARFVSVSAINSVAQKDPGARHDSCACTRDMTQTRSKTSR